MKKTEQIWNRRFILLFLTNLLVLAAFYASIPIIPIYCEEIGITGSKIGIVLTAMSVATILFRPVAGYLLDNFNRGHLLDQFAVIAWDIQGLGHLFPDGTASAAKFTADGDHAVFHTGFAPFMPGGYAQIIFPRSP